MTTMLRQILNWFRELKRELDTPVPGITAEEARVDKLAYAAWERGDTANPFPRGTPRHEIWQQRRDFYEWSDKAVW
ncbi:hypothetical protein [Burkholderia sp. BCC1985]|uniref:hypothetical protein n=1 Tax=Burkholderia sp. BCC1985 TaxID=2817442 RepID=UPI002AB18B1A|nr:hypothetical protein [Burkholderia sp. BCC1985]